MMLFDLDMIQLMCEIQVQQQTRNKSSPKKSSQSHTHSHIDFQSSFHYFLSKLTSVVVTSFGNSNSDTRKALGSSLSMSALSKLVFPSLFDSNFKRSKPASIQHRSKAINYAAVECCSVLKAIQQEFPSLVPSKRDDNMVHPLSHMYNHKYTHIPIYTPHPCTYKCYIHTHMPLFAYTYSIYSQLCINDNCLTLKIAAFNSSGQ